jgi:hypothetical protein
MSAMAGGLWVSTFRVGFGAVEDDAGPPSVPP